MGFFEIGKIVNAHGIKGEVKIVSISDDPDKFDKLKEITVVKKKSEQIYKILSVKYHKQFVIAKLEGINDMNEALKLKGSSVKVPYEKGIVLEADEYYLKDIYDMQVVDESGIVLGTITDIIFTGANDVYEVSQEGKKPFLLPAIKQCILKVDIEKNQMTVKLLEGLIEE